MEAGSANNVSNQQIVTSVADAVVVLDDRIGRFITIHGKCLPESFISDYY